MAVYTWTDGARGHTGYVTLTEKSTSPGSNTSVVTIAFAYATTASIGDFDGYSISGYFKVSGTNLAETTKWATPTGWNSSITNKYLGYKSHGQYTMYSAHDITITHDANGNATVTGSGKFVADTQTTSADGYYTPNLAAKSFTITLTPFDRSPTACGAPTIDRSAGDGTSLTIRSGAATEAGGSPAPPSITGYTYQIATDPGMTQNVSTGAVAGPTGGTATTISNLSATQTYYFRTRATNDEGSSPWSSVVTVQGAPSFTTVNVPAKGFPGAPYGGQVSADRASSLSVLPSPASLPPGVSMSGAGTLSGTPTTAGTFTFSVKASGTGGSTSTSTQTVLIAQSGPLVVVDSTKALTIAAGGVVRSSLYVKVDSGWVQGWMRVYDSSYTDPIDGSQWRPIV